MFFKKFIFSLTVLTFFGTVFASNDFKETFQEKNKLSPVHKELINHPSFNDGMDELIKILKLKEAYKNDQSHIPELWEFVEKAYVGSKKSILNNQKVKDQLKRVELLEIFKERMDLNLEKKTLGLENENMFVKQCSILVSDDPLPTNKYWTTGEDPVLYDNYENLEETVEYVRSKKFPQEIWKTALMLDNPFLGISTIVLSYISDAPLSVFPFSDGFKPHAFPYNSNEFGEHDEDHHLRLVETISKETFLEEKTSLSYYKKAKNNEVMVASAIYWSLLENREKISEFNKKRTLISLFYLLHEKPFTSGFSGSRVTHKNYFKHVCNDGKVFTQNSDKLYEFAIYRELYTQWETLGLSSSNEPFEIKEILPIKEDDLSVNLVCKFENYEDLKTIKVQSTKKWLFDRALDNHGFYELLTHAGYQMKYKADPNNIEDSVEFMKEAEENIKDMIGWLYNTYEPLFEDK